MGKSEIRNLRTRALDEPILLGVDGEYFDTQLSQTYSTLGQMEELLITAADGQNGSRILHLAGPLTLRTIFDFQATARQEAVAPMIIDVSAVPYMDSAGLGSILGLFASAQRKQVGFAVAGASDRIRTLFEVTHVQDVLPSFLTVADAEASLAKAAGA